MNKKTIFKFLTILIYIFLSNKNLYSQNNLNLDSLRGFRQVDFKKNNIIEKILYADTSNFMHKKLYPCAKCYLRNETYIALLKANKIFQKYNLILVIHDCYRPLFVQKQMYDFIRNPNFIAFPNYNAMHSRGLAVDVSLADSLGNLLDFGTQFDSFSKKANYSYKNFSKNILKNRKILRDVMVQVGFLPYDGEWWHFTFPKYNYKTDNKVWNCK